MLLAATALLYDNFWINVNEMVGLEPMQRKMFGLIYGITRNFDNYSWKDLKLQIKTFWSIKTEMENRYPKLTYDELIFKYFVFEQALKKSRHKTEIFKGSFLPII